MNIHNLILAGRSQNLPIISLGDRAQIAFFDMLGDVSLAEAVAREIIESRRSDCEVIVVPETKAIPLAHELARQLGISYVVVRKQRPLLPDNALSETIHAFTSDRSRTLWLDERYGEKLRNKNAWIVDDVITTGSTMAGAEKLARRAGAIVTDKIAVLREGDGPLLTSDVRTIGSIPVFAANVPVSSGFRHRALEVGDHFPMAYTAISKTSFCYRVWITRFVLENGFVPFNPFMAFDFAFFGLLSKDTVLIANNSAVRLADELWSFGQISDGMYAEISLAKKWGRPVKYFSISEKGIITATDEESAQYDDDVIAQLRQLSLFQG